MAITLHLAFAHEDYTLIARLQAAGLCCVALLCTGFAPVRVLPAVAIGVGYLYLALGLPIFWKGTTFSLGGTLYLPARALEDATLAALAYASTVVAVALITDRLTRRSAWRVTNALESKHSQNSAQTFVARLIAACSVAANTAIVIGVSFGALKNPVVMFGSPLISLTLLYWDAEQRGVQSARTVYWATVALLGFEGLLTGMVQDALMPVIVSAALMWAHRSRLPVELLVGCAAVLIFLTPVKHIYRDLAWYENTPTTAERLLLWGVAIERAYGGGRANEEEQLVQSMEGARSRVGTLGQVAHIFEAVPSRIPFAGPDRWLELPNLMIPRVFWREKPVLDSFFNRHYTYTFRIQTRKSRGSMTLPAVGDGYWRLGWPGVFIEASLLGLVLGLSQALSRGGNRSALLLAGALMQVRTDTHVFGNLAGTIQLVGVACIVAVVAKVLSDLMNEGQQEPADTDVRPRRAAVGPMEAGHAAEG